MTPNLDHDRFVDHIVVNREIFLAFLDEMLAYVPALRAHLVQFAIDGSKDDLLSAHRLAHTIRGASAMVGLHTLSRAALNMEERFERFIDAAQPADDAGVGALDEDLSFIETAIIECAGAHIDAPENAASHDPLGANDLLALDIADFNPHNLAAEVEMPSFDDLLALAPPEPVIAPPPETIIDDDQDEQIDPDMLEVFGMEAEDHLRTITHALARLEAASDDMDALAEIRRSTHTLKGAAGVVGLRTLASLAHAIEDVLDRLFDDRLRPSAELTTQLFRAAGMLEELSRGAPAAASRARLAAITHDLAAYRDATSAPEDFPAPAHDLAVPTAVEEAAPAAVVADGTTTRARRTVRVPLERLDALVRLVGELVVNRTEQELHLQRLTREVTELRRGTDRLRRVSTRIENEYEAASFRRGVSVVNSIEHARVDSFASTSAFSFAIPTSSPAPLTPAAHGFDDLEFDRYTEFHRLTRELSEATSDAASVQDELGTLVSDLEVNLTRQRRLTLDAQESLMRVRMVPLASIAMRLARSVRLAADAEGKSVRLEIIGDTIELDTIVLDNVADPLLHILRNAVSHGIETPAVRRSAGKPAHGTISLRAAYQGTHVTLAITDDGAGVSAANLRGSAIENNFLSAADAAALTDAEAFDLMFLPGLSTANEISEVSGRGVGMDVVRDGVARLGGSLDVTSVTGRGATFTLRLPLALAVTRAAIIRAGGESYALALESIEHVTRINRAEVTRQDGRFVVRSNDEVYPLRHLALWAKSQSESGAPADAAPVMLLKVADERLALVADELIENREIVIKNLGAHLRRVRGLAGATLLGDGTVLPVIDAHQLVRDARTTHTPDAARTTPAPPRRAARADEPLRVMIVDDSPSVRRVMARFVSAAGWQPVIANDGFDALEALHDAGASLPDVVLLDVEMPRMDGYELLATLRADPRTARLPIVMITSRAGERHRQKGLSLGASEYLSKPYDEDELRAHIRRLAGVDQHAV